MSAGWGAVVFNFEVHQRHDDYYYFTHFLDTDFVYGRALAQVAGTAVIRLADAELIPLEFTNVADTVHVYINELHALLHAKQTEIAEINQQIETGVFAAVNDPRRPKLAPNVEAVPPALNFAPLDNAATALSTAAQRYKKAVESGQNKSARNPASVLKVNTLLMQSERQYLDRNGLPKREWFKNLLYAPGFYTGYSVKTMPGVREGIEQKQYALIDTEVAKLAQALQREIDLINQAAAILEAE